MLLHVGLGEGVCALSCPVGIEREKVHQGAAQSLGPPPGPGPTPRSAHPLGPSLLSSAHIPVSLVAYKLQEGSVHVLSITRDSCLPMTLGDKGSDLSDLLWDLLSLRVSGTIPGTGRDPLLSTYEYTNG